MKKIGIVGILLILLTAPVFADTMTLRPNGQGNFTAWTNASCASTAEWNCVDETSSNGNTDYVSTSTSGANESFAFADTGLTAGDEVISMKLTLVATRASASRNRIFPLLVLSGSSFLGSVKILSSSYSWYSQQYTTNPATGLAWTATDIDGLQAGASAAANSTGGGRLTQAFLTVNYIPAGTNCTDSDAYNTSNAGSVFGALGGVPYQHDDTCVDNATVREFYCSSYRSYNFTMPCGGNYTGACVNGACI